MYFETGTTEYRRYGYHHRIGYVVWHLGGPKKHAKSRPFRTGLSLNIISETIWRSMQRTHFQSYYHLRSLCGNVALCVPKRCLPNAVRAGARKTSKTPSLIPPKLLQQKTS